MGFRKNMADIVNLINLEIIDKALRGFLCLFLVGFWTTLCRPLYGQGTLGETAASMEIQQELNGSGKQPTPKQPTDTPKKAAATEPQSLTRFEKVAQKLIRSMQLGKFDQADFSEEWNTLIPKDTNFSDGMNALCKPVFEQRGKAEKLKEGRMTGVNRAVFAVQFTKGAMNMTISLDQQDKIVEWTLPRTERLASRPAVSEQPTKPVEPQAAIQGASSDTNIPEINDFNDFQRELNRINLETRSEEEQWLGRLENNKKVELLRTIDDLVAAQLRFIRKIAETKPEQTAMAIDLVLKQRQERLNKLVTKLEDETRQERQQQIGERRRTTRTGGQEQSTRERPQRRPRETTTNTTEGPQY
jgi:hypothetical protein